MSSVRSRSGGSDTSIVPRRSSSSRLKRPAAASDGSDALVAARMRTSARRACELPVRKKVPDSSAARSRPWMVAGMLAASSIRSVPWSASS
jgi:hypothetical protein